MLPDIFSSFSSYLRDNNIDFSQDGSVFHVFSPPKNIRIVKLSDFQDYCVDKEKIDITIYEDLWKTKHSLVSQRLLSNLGRQDSVFARCCRVESITADIAGKFLDDNHILGRAKSKFKYGLYTNKPTSGIKENELVAVATFSGPRPMSRNGKMVSSYEWVRYAGISGYRVIGGMGKFMKHFVENVSPDEIMSYADKDWGRGDVYKQLGFRQVSDTVSLSFYIDRITLERASIKKLRNNSQSESTELNIEDYYILRNQGNLKFLWMSPFVK